MGLTTSFRKQHDELLLIAEEIQAGLDAEDHSTDPQGVADLIDKLASVLTGHLSLEDRRLYPLLLGDENEALRATAQLFVAEMGEIADVFKEYRATWSASTIQGEPSRFARETSEFVTTLVDRINRENDDLYAMMDLLGE